MTPYVPSCRIVVSCLSLELLELEELNGGKQRVSVDLLEHLQVDFLILTFFVRKQKQVMLFLERLRKPQVRVWDTMCCVSIIDIDY